MRTIVISDFAIVQEYQKVLNIPFTCSISTWVYCVINKLKQEGEKEIELVFWSKDDESVLPKTYRNNPWSWVILILKGKINFSNIRAFKRNGAVVISVSDSDVPKRSFKPKLVASLQTSNRVVFNLEDIPFAYKKQPYYLVSILKDQFPSLAVTIQEKQYIYTHNEKI